MALAAVDLSLTTQRLTDPLATPSGRATTSAAAVSDGYCSTTRRTHRSLTFGSIILGMVRILPTHKDAARYAGRFTATGSYVTTTPHTV